MRVGDHCLSSVYHPARLRQLAYACSALHCSSCNVTTSERRAVKIVCVYNYVDFDNEHHLPMHPTGRCLTQETIETPREFRLDLNHQDSEIRPTRTEQAKQSENRDFSK